MSPSSKFILGCVFVLTAQMQCLSSQETASELFTDNTTDVSEQTTNASTDNITDTSEQSTNRDPQTSADYTEDNDASNSTSSSTPLLPDLPSQPTTGGLVVPDATTTSDPGTIQQDQTTTADTTPQPTAFSASTTTPRPPITPAVVHYHNSDPALHSPIASHFLADLQLRLRGLIDYFLPNLQLRLPTVSPLPSTIVVGGGPTPVDSRTGLPITEKPPVVDMQALPIGRLALPQPFGNLFDPCPVCFSLDSAALPGEWHLIYANDNFLKVQMPHLMRLAAPTTSGQQQPRGVDLLASFGGLFTPMQEPMCVRLIIGSPVVFGQLEDYPVILSFQVGLPTAAPLTFAGSLRFAGDGRYLLTLADNRYMIQLCASYSNVVSHGVAGGAVSPPTKTIIFTDLTGFPGCGNNLVLTNDRTAFVTQMHPTAMSVLRQRGANGGVNPLRYVACHWA